MVVLNYHNIEKYLQNRFLLCKDKSGSKIVVIFDPSDLVYLPNSLHSYNIKLLTKQEFYDLLEQNFSHFNIIKAKYLLNFVSPEYTAKNIDFAKVAIGVNILFFATLIKYTLFFHIINHLTYFAQNILKTVLFSAKIGANDNDTKLIELPIPYQEDFLPIYTILIPLYKEVEKLDSILLAMEDLLYPKHKLDVKLILESDDYLLIDLIKSKNLPIYIHVIITPLSFPRTKPKALNYAMNYVIGEYVTIYDAEDRPEPNQLIKAVTMFQSLPRNYACVQARAIA